MTRRERLEARAEKRETWAEGRAAKSAVAFRASDMREERSGIPFGQPVLVGHHSEGRHRRALAKADNAMRRSVEHHNKAKEHASAAASIRSALDRSIFSDDENAIEALEAKAAKLDEKAATANRINLAWRRALKKHGGDIDKAAAELAAAEKLTDRTRDEMARQARQFSCVCRTGPMSATHERAEARRCRQRIEEIKRRAVVTAAAAATASGCTVVPIEFGSCRVTFAEKPDRSVLVALRAAGFRWSAPSWYGKAAALPSEVAALAGTDEAAAAE